MSDLIDRHEAIDAVCMEWCGVKHQDCKHPFDDEEDDYYWCDGCETVLRTLPDLPPAQPEQQHGRIFREIVVKYPSYCTYPEYKGKPYFSIKYTENGQEFIGYGTYKPDVLSKYLKEYFMPPAQLGTNLAEVGTRAVRGYPIDADALMEKVAEEYGERARDRLYQIIRYMPPAQPERIKGHWIVKHGSDAPPICDKCGYESRTTIKEVVDQNLKMIYCTGIDIKSNFCPNCGADMRGERNEP